VLIKLQPLIKVEEYINNVTFFARNFMLYFQASSPLVLTFRLKSFAFYLFLSTSHQSLITIFIKRLLVINTLSFSPFFYYLPHPLYDFFFFYNLKRQVVVKPLMGLNVGFQN